MLLPSSLFTIIALASGPEVNTDWTYAVVSAGQGAPNLPFAGTVRAELARHRTVLDEETVRVRLAGPRASEAPPSLEEINAMLERAATLDADGKTDDALRVLDGLIGRLSADVSFNSEKGRLLHLSHVEAARILIGKAGKKETGRGETDAGRQARAHLVTVLGVDPTFVLDAATYSPRVRLTMDYARQDYARMPKGSLAVTSVPNGASVFFEGRKLGETPLRLTDVAPLGSYRVWAEYGGIRSIQRVVQLQEGDNRVVIPLSQEGPMGTRPGSLDVDAGDVDAAIGLPVVKLLAVHALAIVTEFPCGSTRCAGLTVVTKEGALRRAQIPTAAANAAAIASAWIRNGTPDPLLMPQAPPSSFVLKARDIVVLPVEGVEAADTATSMEARVRAAVEQWVGHAPRPVDEVRAALATLEQRRGALCRNTRACLEEIGRTLGASAVVRTRMHVDGAGVFHAVLHAVEVDSGMERVRLVTLGPVDKAQRALPDEVARLVAPGTQRATLAVTTEAPGIHVFLDDVPVDPASAARGIEGLPEGAHTVRASVDQLALEKILVLVAGERTAVRIRRSTSLQILEGEAPSAHATATAAPAQPAATAAPEAVPVDEDARPSPILPVGVGIAGAGLLALAAPVIVAAGVLGGVASVLYFTSQRTPSGRIVARPDESAEELDRRANGIAAMGIVSPVLGAMAVVLVVAGVATLVAATVLFILRR